MNVEKKRRTRLACNRCRERKKKCDGIEPICQSCIDHGIKDCKYQYNLDKRRPYTRSYVESLKKHIKNLEKKLEKYENNFNDSNHISSNTKSGDENNLNDINELIDCSGKFKAIDGYYHRYYGPRSAISIILNNNTPLIDTNLLLKKDKFDVLELESKPELENYLYELYFAFQNSTLVFVWKEMFFRQLKLPESERNSNFITKSLQYVMLAIGTLFDPNNKDMKFVISNQFARKARNLLESEICNPTISTVQTCGLLSLLYIYLNEDALSFYFNGAGISTSYSLGLNIGDQFVMNSDIISNEEIEQRRIVFWAMYLLERSINNIIGRPAFLKSDSMISMVPSEIGFPEYDIWENPNIKNNIYESSNILNNSNNIKKMYTRCFSLVTYTIELWIITSKPLDHIYLCFKPSSPSDLEYIVNKANIELIQFENTFPEYLTLVSIFSFQNRDKISPGIFVFQLKYQYIKILLHKIFFIRTFELPQQFNDDQIYLHKKICFESAININKLVALYGKSFKFRNFEFCTPDIICTAAIVLLFFIRNPNLNGKETNVNEENNIRSSSTKAFLKLNNSLVYISATNLWAKRCLCVIEQIKSDWEMSPFLQVSVQRPSIS